MIKLYDNFSCIFVTPVENNHSEKLTMRALQSKVSGFKPDNILGNQPNLTVTHLSHL